MQKSVCVTEHRVHVWLHTAVRALMHEDVALKPYVAELR